MTLTDAGHHGPGRLRAATPDDLDGLLALIASHPGQLLPRRRAEIAALLDTFWVVEEDGELAGCCCLEVYSPKIAEVRSLAVRDASRGRGYGAALVQTAVQEARRRGIPQILVVTSNPAFFSRVNFRTCLNEKYALFWEDPASVPQGVEDNPQATSPGPDAR